MILNFYYFASSFNPIVTYTEKQFHQLNPAFSAAYKTYDLQILIYGNQVELN